MDEPGRRKEVPSAGNAFSAWSGLLGLTAYLVGIAVSGQGPVLLLVGAVVVGGLVVVFNKRRR